VARSKNKTSVRKVRVLIAVKPPSLLRVIEHLVGSDPAIEIISRPEIGQPLLTQVKQLKPDLIITNAELLGQQVCQVLGKVKRASPRSKLIMMGFGTGVMFPMGGDCGIDVYLEEEALVGQLLATTRGLARQIHRKPAPRNHAPKSKRDAARRGK
jgi:DNA-binding NarL/FixJ family response regulator